MPYFAWQGIGLSGKLYRGKTFARSTALLDEQLFKRDIALLSYKPAQTFLLPPLKRMAVIGFFERLAALLGAGVLLPDALIILTDYSSSIRLQMVVEQVGIAINEGYSLSSAGEKYPSIFDQITLHLVAVGQEAGKLAASLAALVAYQHSLQEFRKKMKSAAMMPLMLFIFFVLICLLIIFVMLPRLVAITGLPEQQLPAITRTLLWVSKTGHGWFVAGFIGCIIGIGLLVRTWLLRAERRDLRAGMMLKLPFVRDITIASQMGWFCAALALLLRNGVSVVPSLTIAQQVVTNSRLRKVIQQITDHVQSGKSFYQALAQESTIYCWPEVVAIIQVGEQTGQLAEAMEKSAQLYHADAMRRLTIIATVIQPLFLVTLGLLIGLLIIAIYAPLFTMSFTVG
jgi:type II secretory pathway component PulF